MVEKRDSPGWKFYENHLKFFYNKDVNGLVANDYNEDALLITFDFAVRGHEQLKQVFRAYLDMIGEFTVISTDNFTEAEDVIFLEATLDTAKAGIRKVYDVFILRNGKISHHITGVR